MSNIKELENSIRQYAKEYYAGNPSISDEEFDNLVDRLRELHPDSEVLSSVGWGSGVEDIDGKKVKHKYQLVGSLDKIKDANSIPYYGQIYIVSAKLDGLSAVCYYENNELVRAVTRGDGTTGVDITDKIRVILDNETTLKSDFPFTGSIRGELVISNKNWEIMRERNSLLKSQRNTAAGIINRNEITEDINFVDFLPYNMVGYESDVNDFYQTQLDIYKFLIDNFYYVTPFIALKPLAMTYDTLESILNEMRKTYLCDGLVITHNDVILDTETYAMKYRQIAFKFPAETKEARVTGVTYNLTRTNKLVPVINIEPTELSGATVSNVTGFNCKFIKDNKICKDAIIGVQRSGEVIPDFQYLVSSPENDELPKECPICHKELSWVGVDLVCTNEECGNRDYRDLQCWVNNIGRVDNIGDTLKFKFLDELGYDTIEKLYKTPMEINMKWARGTQKVLFLKVMKKLLEEPIDAVDALCALNIPRLGRVSAQKLTQNKDLIKSILGYINASKIDELAKVVGRATAESIYNNYSKFGRLDLIWDRLVFSEPIDKSSMIRVAITGKLSVKRDDFMKLLNANGFDVTGINKDTKYLITDNPNSGSSKNKLADKFGITKITEEEFRSKFINKE